MIIVGAGLATNDCAAVTFLHPGYDIWFMGIKLYVNFWREKCEEDVSVCFSVVMLG